MITFLSLQESHFLLLLKWLEAPHVKMWWDRDIHWTPKLIREKYGSYVKGYKDNAQKPIHAYLICYNTILIGYIQYYNVHDFPREQGCETVDFPESCAALDWYIGEIAYTGKGIGSKALALFLDEHIFPEFDIVLVDPDTMNTRAIHAYEKVGFLKVKTVNDGKITCMIKESIK